MSFRKIVVGISGGVDSAVSAILLKQKGYEVCGVFMKNWDEIDEKGQCSGEQDWIDAQNVCKKLDIPLFQVNFVKDYWHNVFNKFLEDYQNGFTPNPDIQCNRYIKFDQFYKYARQSLKADAIATGHYAQSSFGPYLEFHNSNKNVKLLQAVDKFKDQTFFLSQVKQNALKRTMFPIGVYCKSEVKDIAKKFGLNQIANKRESTGICFIGHRNFKEFIQEYLKSKPGDFIDIDTGEIIGKHNGIHQWTIGQRCRMSGCLKPYFIARKIVKTNQILIAAGTDHPALFTQLFLTESPSWINENTSVIINQILKCKFRFQHTKPLVDCNLEINTNGLIVHLDIPLRAITPGQYAVFYLNNECLGSARITTNILTLFDKNQHKINSINS